MLRRLASNGMEKEIICLCSVFALAAQSSICIRLDTIMHSTVIAKVCWWLANCVGTANKWSVSSHLQCARALINYSNYVQWLLSADRPRCVLCPLSLCKNQQKLGKIANCIEWMRHTEPEPRIHSSKTRRTREGGRRYSQYFCELVYVIIIIIYCCSNCEELSAVDEMQRSASHCLCSCRGEEHWQCSLCVQFGCTLHNTQSALAYV